MADFDKENTMPVTSSDPLSRSKGLSPSPKKAKKGRSKSIGPGSLEEPAPESKISARDRRKSAFVPATKSILSKNEDAERAARRKTMVNRRVSFAPEATLHTWDIVIDNAQDQTTSTDSNDSTRRASGFNRESSSPAASDAAQEAEDRQLLSPESHQDGKEHKQSKSFSNPEDAFAANDFSGSEESGSEEEAGEEAEEAADEESDDGESTAMSLDGGDATVQSEPASEDSTGSSLTARLQAAAQMAGTRGIEYDEFGDDVSMEIVENEITNAIQPWMQQNQLERIGSAGLDQENVNPFSPAFKAEVMPQQDDEQDEEEDMSMDVTRAVGGIIRASRAAQPQSSPASSDGDATMEFTQAVGKITGQKRRRSTTDSGSPGVAAAKPQSKRRRSSVARSSVGDETMDLTMVYGSIQNTGSPAKPERRRSLRSRRSSGKVSDSGDATMDMTMAVGGIKHSRQSDQDDSFNENEELSMELTNVIGGIREHIASTEGSRAATPRAQSPSQAAANTTPKDQDRFKNTPDLGAKQLLMPLFQKEAQKAAERQTPETKPRKSLSPMRLSASPAGRPSSKDSTPDQREAMVKSPVNQEASYPMLPQPDEYTSPVRSPTSSPKRRQSRRNVSSEQRRFDQQLQAPQQSPMADKQQRSSPLRHATATPERPRSSDEAKNLTDTIGMMATPRKETLKTFTPKKQTPAKQASPLKAVTPRGRPTPKSSSTILPSPLRRLNEDLQNLSSQPNKLGPVGLQDFLTKAGIRFMDLTTTKRRLTTAVPPSQAKGSQDTKAEQVNLEAGVVAAACTIPELELYQHACHELKRFTKEGRRVIGELEEETRQNQPPLLQVYMSALPSRKATLDVQMRDMKTNARLRSKEMWYAWRSQLLEELMGGLSRIGEGLIQDVEILTKSEAVLDEALPPLIKQREELQQEADNLEQTVNAVPEEDKAQLNEARESLAELSGALSEKRMLLDKLRKQVEEQDNLAEHLQDSELELTAAIQESNRIREACRGVSVDEISKLQESVAHIESESGWSITSASPSPSTITMCYRFQIQLFFHPRAFNKNTSNNLDEVPNAPISLTYVGDKRQPLTTTLRFFLQLLRASLQALPQAATKIFDLLNLVSSGWDSVVKIAESERRLNLETPTTSRILGDERMEIVAEVLLPKVRTKVRARFELSARVKEAERELEVVVEPRVEVVYGELYDEKNMTKYLKGLAKEGDDWHEAVRSMREKLVAKGEKGVRK